MRESPASAVATTGTSVHKGGGICLTTLQTSNHISVSSDIGHVAEQLLSRPTPQMASCGAACEQLCSGFPSIWARVRMEEPNNIMLPSQTCGSGHWKSAGDQTNRTGLYDHLLAGVQQKLLQR